MRTGFPGIIEFTSEKLFNVSFIDVTHLRKMRS